MADYDSLMGRGFLQPPYMSASSKQTSQTKKERMSDYELQNDDWFATRSDDRFSERKRSRIDRSPSTVSDTSSDGQCFAMTDTMHNISTNAASVKHPSTQADTESMESNLSPVPSTTLESPLAKFPAADLDREGSQSSHNDDSGRIIRTGDHRLSLTSEAHKNELQAETLSSADVGETYKSDFNPPLQRFLAQEDDRPYIEDQPGKMEEEWGKLRSLRTVASSLRSRTRSKRQELQQRDRAKNSADEAFMQYVRRLRFAYEFEDPHNQVFKDPGLESYYKAMQDARDLYGPEEYEYSLMEDKLDETEFDMAKSEDRIHQSLHRNPPESQSWQQNLQINSGPFPLPPQSLLGMSSDDHPEYDPLQADYLSRLGDLDLANESLQILDHDQRDILRLKSSRAHMNEGLDEDEQDFLDTFASRKASIIGEIAAIEQDVERMKEACLQAGIDISGNINWSGQDSTDDMTAPDQPLFQETVVDDCKAQEGSHDLLPSIKSVVDPAREDLKFLITSFEGDNKGDRVKSWMLETLSISKFEVQLLVGCFLRVLDIFNFYKWQTRVLNWQFCVLFYWDTTDMSWSKEVWNSTSTRFSAAQTESLGNIDRRGYDHVNLKLRKRSVAMSFKTKRRTKSAPASIDLGDILHGSEMLKLFRS